MISFRNFALRRGERLLLSDVDLALHAGHRVGVVGRNGAGKSSLFAALMGEIEPDKGDIDLPGKARIASVAQETPHLPDPAIDFVLSGDAAVHAAVQAEANAFAAEDWEAVAEAHHRLEELNGYDASARAGRLLHGLGFPTDTHAKPVSDFSGGWRVRLNVARALMTPSDLLLLDEPTNHLDLEMRLALTMALQDFAGAVLVVSHDRHLLKSTTDEFLLVADGRIQPFEGDLDDYARWLVDYRARQQPQSSAAPAADKTDKRAQRQAAAALRQQLAPHKKQAEKLEQELGKVQEKLAVVETQLGDSGLYEAARKDELRQRLAEQAQLKAREAELEETWLLALETLEALQQQLEDAE